MKIYNVTGYITATKGFDLDIKADSEEEAKEKVLQLSDIGIDFLLSEYEVDIDIETVDILGEI